MLHEVKAIHCAAIPGCCGVLPRSQGCSQVDDLLAHLACLETFQAKHDYKYELITMSIFLLRSMHLAWHLWMLKTSILLGCQLLFCDYGFPLNKRLLPGT